MSNSFKFSKRMAGETFFLTTPNFLKRLLLDFCEEKIELICLKETIQIEQIENNVEDTIVNELDLTGTPLQVPLEDDNVDVTLVLDRPRNWTKNEACYHPLNVDIARKSLNLKLQKSKLNIPRYCLCDGNNGRHIILLGAKQTETAIIRTIAYILPSELADNTIFSKEFVSKLKFLDTPNAHVVYSIRKLYLLYGPKNLHELSGCDGQIKIEFRSLNHVLHELFLNPRLTMELKVVIGDAKSDLCDSWNDFCIVYQYFNLAISGNLFENIHVHNINLTDNEIIDNLNNMLSLYEWANISNERSNFWLQLWNILKYCENLQILQDCVKILLIQLIENPSIKCMLEADTTVTRLLSILLERNFELPTKQQCFGLLMEIGFEKLKHDYCVILDKYEKIKHRSILQHLSERLINSRENPFLINLKTFKLKLSHLYQIHMIAESLLFYQKTLKLSTTSFNNFIEFINKTLIKIREFERIQLIPQIFECCFNLNLNDFNMVEALLPFEVHIQLRTESTFSENTTMYFYSEFPPIPNIDYNSNKFRSNVENKGKKCYYVTKLERLSNKVVIN